MNKTSTFIWLSIILIFLLPASAGRLILDLTSGIIFLLLFTTLLISGIGWLSWKKIKSNIKTCDSCGANYFSDSLTCPICGSNGQLKKTNSEINIPASSATIDITAEETE